MKLLDYILHPQQVADQRRADIYKSLVHWEGQVGGSLFGPVQDGGRREFFCLDEHTWVWHEEWNDQNGRHAVTTRYDVRPSGILKSQGNSGYQALTPQELRNLKNAITLYRDQVLPELQRLRDAK